MEQVTKRNVHFSWDAILKTLEKSYHTTEFTLINFNVFVDPYEDGKNIGEFTVGYTIQSGSQQGKYNHATWGLYADGTIECFAD